VGADLVFASEQFEVPWLLARGTAAITARKERMAPMKFATPCSLIRRWGFLAMLGAVALLTIPSLAWSDQLSDFTGYTRPGVPDGKAIGKKGPVEGVALEAVFVSFEGNKEAILGGTVHFTVIDTRATDEDAVWRDSIAAGMKKAFVPGKDNRGNSSPDFDATARYLYLYQTINDMPQALNGVSNSSVYLIDPTLLTSWGHFEGHGFAIFTQDKTGKQAIRSVSYGNPVDGPERVYKPRDREHLLDNPLTIGKSPPIKGKREIIGAAEGEEPVRSPNTVVLTFGTDNYDPRFSGITGFDYNLRPVVGVRDGDRGAERGGERAYQNRSYLRVDWRQKDDNLLQPKERGAIFGFTSNYPPTYDDVRLRGIQVKAPGGIKPVADVPAANAPAAPGSGPVGAVPVPVPPVPGPAMIGSVSGSLGGQFPITGGTIGGSGGGFPGIGGGFAVPSSGLGGGGGLGNTGQAQQQSPTQNQNQQQQQQQPLTQTQSINITDSLNQQQNQNQQQKQSQHQHQSNQNKNNCCPDGNMVPGPSSGLLALIGLPFLLLFRRWNTAKAAVAR
jgi:hypothetical protein